MLPILIVDDSPEDRSFAERAFRLNRIRNPIILIGGGKRCLEYFKGEGEFEGRELPALVFIDLAMPEVSRWEVVETIRQRAPTIPVVLLTELADSALLSRARGCRVRVIVKPFRLQTLKATLVEALYAQIG